MSITNLINLPQLESSLTFFAEQDLIFLPYFSKIIWLKKSGLVPYNCMQPRDEAKELPVQAT